MDLLRLFHIRPHLRLFSQGWFQELTSWGRWLLPHLHWQLFDCNNGRVMALAPSHLLAFLPHCTGLHLVLHSCAAGIWNINAPFWRASITIDEQLSYCENLVQYSYLFIFNLRELDIKWGHRQKVLKEETKRMSEQAEPCESSGSTK